MGRTLNLGYEKIDDKRVKITETVTNVNETIVTLNDLKAMKIRKETARQQTVDQHTANLAKFDQEIALIDEKINQAETDGVTEVDEQGRG